MPVYKHVPAQFADEFERGTSIAVGTLAYYREFESDRSDRLEGAVEGKIGIHKVEKNGPVEEREWLSQMGIMIDQSSSGIVEGVTVGKILPTTYIFSVSKFPNQRRIERGEVIFEIRNLFRFAQKIGEAANRDLDRPIIGNVKYKPVTGTWGVGEIWEPDAFCKGPDWSWEQEVRIAWKPRSARSSNLNELVIVNCPSAAEHIFRV